MFGISTDVTTRSAKGVIHVGIFWPDILENQLVSGQLLCSFLPVGRWK